MPPVPSANSIVPFETPRDHAAPKPISVDVIFPVLHGTYGEDGTLQGLLELADIPYVGSGVLGSAAGMDKDIMKRLFCDSRLPLVKHLTVLRSEWERQPKKIEKMVDSALKYPVFVKPANLGSSVGISKAHDASELPAAMNEAARYDRKIIIEQGVGGKRHKAREIECAVLGNDEPIASICGEIVPSKEFYDYDAKYIDPGSELLIPARLDHTQVRQIQEMAIRAFQSVECSGLARVDFLMDPVTGHFYLNEVNTMPGFTAISMYPKLWARDRHRVSGADRPPDPACAGALRGQEAQSVHEELKFRLKFQGFQGRTLGEGGSGLSAINSGAALAFGLLRLHN